MNRLSWRKGFTAMLRVSRAAAPLVLIVVFLAHAGVCRGQMPGPALDPSICSSMQKAIEDMIAISRSNSLTDEQKVDALMKSWEQSWNSVQGQGETSPEVAGLLKELSQSMARLMAKVLAAAHAPRKPVSPETERELDALKKQTMPFLALMKLLCPNLVIPEIVTK